MHFPEEEIIYLALHFLGGKVRYHLHEEMEETGLSENNPYLDKVMDLLCIKMSQICLVDFQKDKVLMNGLKLHLNTALNRLEYGLSVSNPMLNEIKKLYPYMFDMVIHALEEIHSSTSLNIPEEEAGYITLHFQASIERLKDQRGKEKNTVIVCHMGVGMSQLLRTKIEQQFRNVHVMGCIGRADLESFLEKSNVDLVISTISLPELKVPHIVVSPLLAASDEKRLEHFIKQQDHPVKKGNAESILLKYTTPFLVFLQEEAANKYELIEKMGNTLFQKGYVEKEYSQNAIIRERMSATTIGSGIAIPHGHPGLIKHSAIAVASLKESLEWGAEKVSLVFMLAVKNDRQEETRQLFRELSYLSSQPVFIQSMIKENNILTFLSTYKDLINQGE
jgi:activator of the mannose operon, transcriptional antiterminator